MFTVSSLLHQSGAVWQPAVVVGVVGIGHAPGIAQNWGRDLDIVPLLRYRGKRVSRDFLTRGYCRILRGVSIHEISFGSKISSIHKFHANARSHFV